jgi:hypothetical protein
MTSNTIHPGPASLLQSAKVDLPASASELGLHEGWTFKALPRRSARLRKMEAPIMSQAPATLMMEGGQEGWPCLSGKADGRWSSRVIGQFFIGGCVGCHLHHHVSAWLVCHVRLVNCPGALRTSG